MLCRMDQGKDRKDRHVMLSPSLLHTGCSTMTHHPLVHVIVPSGGPSPDGTRWIARRPGLFLPVKVP